MTGAIIAIVIGIFVLIKYRKEVEGFSHLPDYITTNDLRITASSFSYIFLNLNSGTYDFGKFSKTEDGEIVLRLRYILPENIYQNTIALGTETKLKLAHFKIVKNELSQTEFKLRINNFYSSYSMNFEIKDREQFESVKKSSANNSWMPASADGLAAV